MEIIKLKKIKLLDNVLQINIDDCYKNLKVNNKKEKFKIRVITFNTGLGWDKIKKRNKLLNKRFTYLISNVRIVIKQKDMANFIIKKINDFYEFEIFPKLIINGDGADWIRGLSKKLNATFINDKFHIYKTLSKLFLVKNKNIKDKNLKSKKIKEYFKAIEFVKNGNYLDLILLLIDNNISDNMLKYFQNIREGIENQKSEFNIGGSAESDVFHFIKSNCGGARIFSYNHFVNMIYMKADLYNNK
ncbi:UPF0236 family transposase-like protein [Spiroplasma endosymbiont of Dasysyrphus albostriatus]|uniref:UPF0236 family transposase-like protein n=1 Tax=Spiroplasma endosymbiont of Dasysyrphus albostriatus TaxID=3066299 RepID=UPI0030D24798